MTEWKKTAKMMILEHTIHKPVSCNSTYEMPTCLGHVKDGGSHRGEGRLKS